MATAVLNSYNPIDPFVLTTEAYNISGTAYFDEQFAENTINFSAETIFAFGAALAQLVIAQNYATLARNYYKLYNNQRIFYYRNFQNNVNGELGLLNSVFAIPQYAPQYNIQASNLAIFVLPNDFSSAWWDNHANMYHAPAFRIANKALGFSGTNPGEPEQLDEASITSDFATYLYRYEEHRADVYNERTWEWQNQSLNLGVKQANIVESGLATSFKFMDTANGNMADFFATQSNGLAKFGGYRGSIDKNSALLSASTEHGRALAISPHLGNDIASTFPYRDNGYSTTSSQQFETVQ